MKRRCPVNQFLHRNPHHPPFAVVGTIPIRGGVHGPGNDVVVSAGGRRPIGTACFGIDGENGSTHCAYCCVARSRERELPLEVAGPTVIVATRKLNNDRTPHNTGGKKSSRYSAKILKLYIDSRLPRPPATRVCRHRLPYNTQTHAVPHQAQRP